MSFHFKTFSLAHEKSTLKIGTDSVLLASVIPVDEANMILDIGTGCGVIAFCIAYKRSFVNENQHYITGIDIDTDSITEAKQNKANFPKYVGQQIDFLHTSLQDFSVTASHSYDLIVSNPPYFTSSLKPDNPRHLRSKHRDENLSFKALLQGVSRLLSQDGCFYMILPPAEQIEFDTIANNLLFPFIRWEIFPNPYKPVHRLISGYSFRQTAMSLHQLTIRSDCEEFTNEYKEVTDKFYLYKKNVIL